mmetsp:Transcript_50707/g.56623  ORF Transcript_50707/g.56623 Transcript_50707/m.56623 type:complete len:1254 (+) Transcript_50707:116-3877(+)
MEGESMSKETTMGSSRGGFTSKSPTGYQNHSQHHQRNPSMDSTGHHHSHQHQPQPQPQQQQYYLKPHQPAQQQQQQPYHSAAPTHHRNGSSGGSYSSYLPPLPSHHHPSHYHPHYAAHSRSITPGVRSVVSHSFSMEEEQREDGSSRYGGTHYRGQNQREPSGYPRDEYRSPIAEFHSERSAQEMGVRSSCNRGDSNLQQHISQQQQREQQERSFQPPPPLPPPPPPRFNSSHDHNYDGNNHEIPPSVLEGDESRLPSRDVMPGVTSNSSSERIPPSPRDESPVSAIERTQSLGANGGPLKRSFWHHSRPGRGASTSGDLSNEGSLSTSQSPLPQEFMPPKRTKTSASGSEGSEGSPKREKEYIVTARSHIRNNDQKQQPSQPQQPRPQQQQQQHQMLENRGESNGIDSAGSGGVRESPPGANLSPSGSWFNNRAMSWEAREDYFRRDPRSAGSWSSRSPNGRDGPAITGSVPHWTEAPYMPSPRSRHAIEGNPYDTPLQSWDAPPRDWGHHHSPHTPYLSWSTGNHNDGIVQQQQQRNKNENDKKFPREGQEHAGFNNEHRPPMHFSTRSAPPPQSRGMEVIMGSPPMPTTSSSGVGEPLSSIVHSRLQDIGGRRRLEKNGPIKLLALPEDRISLSETLCIVRENVEVFQATMEDVEAPAPGRKHAVTVEQVGLRCIHCRHTTRSSERVKRAVCYPSSIKRIYRTVIDMKLDHFLHCKFVPQNLKDTLQALKANNTRSTGTTMQYFIRAASTLGMVDGPSGVRIVDNNNIPGQAAAISISPQSSSGGKKSRLLTPSPAFSKGKSLNSSKSTKHKKSGEKSDFRINRNSMSSEGTANLSLSEATVPSEIFTGKVALSLLEDKMSLSPLRCFLREQVCAFSATEEDIAVRTPTTFAVSVGQVGIGCIHCLCIPAKLRLNRAVCFPFSIGRIYQSVADIQRFHLSECKMVPKEVREKFLTLQSQSSKGSKGLATRQYWVTSAKKIGLIDTTKGIRFCRDPAVPEKKPVSLDILAQVASSVTTANKPLVLPEDKPHIAEFLYVVMGQLQPCRFTEADRNKRRLKDVGCIGVECKHCAGQVDGRKFFWSSVNAVESNFVSVHTHMMECRMIPKDIKENLAELKKLRKEQTAALKTGSQKSFFGRVWKRLHEEPKQQKEVKEDANESKEKNVVAEAVSGVVDEVVDEIDPIKASFSISLSQDTLDSSIKMTPTTSPLSTEKPFTEIRMMGKLSSESADSNQKIKAVSDKMAIVRMSSP